MLQAEARRKARTRMAAVCAGLVLLTGLAGGGIWYSLDPLPEDLFLTATALDRELRRVETPRFLSERYHAYATRLLALRGRFLAERRRGRPWQNRLSLVSAVRELEVEGKGLLIACLEETAARRLRIERQLVSESRQLERLRVLSLRFDLAPVTPALSRSGALLGEARHYAAVQDLDRARETIRRAIVQVRQAERHALSQMSRYSDQPTLTTWRRWVNETARWTQHAQQPAVVVLKAERRLRVYQAGGVRAEFSVRLGYNGLADKLYEGDGATPEGRFTVLVKKEDGQSRFHKALLLDYPTAEHRRRLQDAKADGRVPRQQGSGGLIEIHGQGSDSLEVTNGCIALDDEDMDAIFGVVSPGTPVTVVGSVQERNTVARQAEALAAHIRRRDAL